MATHEQKQTWTWMRRIEVATIAVALYGVMASIVTVIWVLGVSGR